jgi:uncharacterized protein (DUF1684 family)
MESSTMTSAAVDTFTENWEAWRAERDRDLAAPYGILSITSINFLTEEAVVIQGIPGRWSTAAENRPIVELAEGEELRDGEQTLTGRVALGPFPRPFRQLDSGSIAIRGFHSQGYDIVRPHDPESPLRIGYSTTPAYAPDRSWQIAGRWLPFDQSHPTAIGSVQPRLGRVVDAPGEIEFELEGRRHRLLATPSFQEGHVTLLFRDKTSGLTTYPAQREMIVRLPESGDEVKLDFNRAYNKNCAYTDVAVCPLPPAGNTLDVAIEAGEKIPYERLPGAG